MVPIPGPPLILRPSPIDMPSHDDPYGLPNLSVPISVIPIVQPHCSVDPNSHLSTLLVRLLRTGHAAVLLEHLDRLIDAIEVALGRSGPLVVAIPAHCSERTLVLSAQNEQRFTSKKLAGDIRSRYLTNVGIGEALKDLIGSLRLTNLFDDITDS